MNLNPRLACCIAALVGSFTAKINECKTQKLNYRMALHTMSLFQDLLLHILQQAKYSQGITKPLFWGRLSVRILQFYISAEI